MKKLFFFFIWLFLVIPCQAAIITVNSNGLGDYPTIQAAIDDANNGDEIIVTAGIYTGDGNRDIDFLGKAITVRSTDPNDPNVIAATIINCQGSWYDPHRGFRFCNGETSESIIDGFTIVNGYSPTEIVRGYGYEVGGAIFCDSSSPTIRNCVIKNNKADYWGGGGIYSTDSNPTIINTVIENNQGHHGGGLLCDYSNVVVEGCVINNNSSNYNAAGIYFRCDCDAKIINTYIINSDGPGIGCYESVLVVEGCLIKSNSGGGGGGMWASKSDVTFENCVIADNSSRYYGGGMEFVGDWREDHTLTIINCTVVNNRAGEKGGGILATEYVDVIISNSILFNNTASEGEQISLYATVHVNGASTAKLYYSLLDGGVEGVYYPDDRYGYKVIAENCIDTNPLFAEDYHLQPSSPCIDAGDPNYVAEPNETDLDGNPRVINGRIDMGAYEYNPQIEVAMRFTPQALNPFSKGKWLKAHFVLPEGYMVEDVDVDTPAFVESCNIQSAYIEAFINEDSLVEIVAYFDRCIFCGIGYGETIDIKVVGSFTDGKQFYGIDTVKITNNYLESLAILASHWLENCGKTDYCDGVDLNEDSVVNFKDFSMMVTGCRIEIVTTATE